MEDLNEEVRSLVKSEDGIRGALIHNRVYDPLLFSEGVVQFTAKQYVFLRAYRLGVPIEEACLKADMTVDQADRFLSKPMTLAWLRDRAIKDHIKNEWSEPGKWWEEGNKVWEGQVQPTRAQLKVWEEFGSRVCPVSRETVHSQPKIEINIDPNAVQKAMERQKAIDATIVKETAA